MMSAERKFAVDPTWRVLLKDIGLQEQDVLRQARLPLDLFAREAAALTTDEYFRLWDSMGYLIDDPTFPLKLGQSIPAEAFSPPLFACLCSPNLNAAMSRLAKYKPLVGPMTLKVDVSDQSTTVLLGGIFDGTPVPPTLVATELVFLAHLARMALREEINLVDVYSSLPLPEREAYEEFFGCSIERAQRNGLTFAAEDARKPFLTANEGLWSVFEPQLRKRMADLDSQSSSRERVRACLIEVIASGHCTMADVADRLAVSQRTLQRRLQDEGTNFQNELNHLREELARHYLSKSGYSSAEIAFLLGYDDPNSFIRAFHTWTGQTPETVRSAVRPH